MRPRAAGHVCLAKRFARTVLGRIVTEALRRVPDANTRKDRALALGPKSAAATSRFGSHRTSSKTGQRGEPRWKWMPRKARCQDQARDPRIRCWRCRSRSVPKMTTRRGSRTGDLARAGRHRRPARRSSASDRWDTRSTGPDDAMPASPRDPSAARRFRPCPAAGRWA